jgi:hypothetical protein
VKPVEVLPVESTDALDVSEEKDIIGVVVCMVQMSRTNFQILVSKVLLGVDLRVRFRKFVLALCSVVSTEFEDDLFRGMMQTPQVLCCSRSVLVGFCSCLKL